MSKIRIYSKTEPEFARLQAFASLCNIRLEEHNVTVSRTYFDFGQNWEYSALITTNIYTRLSWQSLCPRDYELIVDCDSVEKLNEYATKYANHINSDESCLRFHLYE